MALKVSCFVFRSLRFKTLWCFSETPNIWRYYFLHCLVFKEHVLLFCTSPLVAATFYSLTRLFQHVNFFFIFLSSLVSATCIYYHNIQCYVNIFFIISSKLSDDLQIVTRLNSLCQLFFAKFSI